MVWLLRMNGSSGGREILPQEFPARNAFGQTRARRLWARQRVSARGAVWIQGGGIQDPRYHRRFPNPPDEIHGQVSGNLLAGRPPLGCPQSARGMRTFGPALLAVLLSAAGAHPQPWLVRGTVSDAASGQPLPAATVQLAGTWRGTIANDEGEYLLEVRGLPAVLKVSYIGYASRDSVLTAAPGRVDFALTPVPFRFEPVVVTAEDPAEAIMREVIRRKQEWRPGLAGYRAEAYTRRVLENEKEIVLIGELASEIYWDRERGLREVVKSRRLTRNQGPDAGYVSALQGFVNFYDDDIPFIGNELIGPTHPDALEQYRFRLLGRRYLDDRVVFDISVEPRNRLQSALEGRVSVLDGEFALLEAELAPSRASVTSVVPLPVIEGMDVVWRQQFRGFAEGVWLPVDYRASMKVKVGMAGLRFPAARFNQVTRLGEYEVNVDMPDSLYAGEEVLRVDSLAVARDSTFARLADKVPLSEREERAYASIDSTLVFERAFRPTGFLARFLLPEPGEERSEPPEKPHARGEPEKREGRSRVPGLAGLKPELRYDRVAGAHLGLKGKRTLRASADPGGLEDGAPPGPAAGRGPGGGLYLAAGAGYDLRLERLSFAGGIEWLRGAGRAAVEYGRGSVPRIPSDSYPPLFNSAQSLLGLDDYFDYYWREGFRWRLGLSLPRRIGLELGFNDEAHSSLEGTGAFNLLGPGLEPPQPCRGGRAAALAGGGLHLWGGPYRPFGVIPNRRVEARVEHGSGAWGATSPSPGCAWPSTGISRPSSSAARAPTPSTCAWWRGTPSGSCRRSGSGPWRPAWPSSPLSAPSARCAATLSRGSATPPCTGSTTSRAPPSSCSGCGTGPCAEPGWWCTGPRGERGSTRSGWGPWATTPATGTASATRRAFR